jgi:ribonuclease-3
VNPLAARWGLADDSVLLRAALTHRSAASTPAHSNERLEFLGDALLGAFVARILVDSLPPDTDEGTLTRSRIAVIRRETLADAGRALGLSALLQVGNGERRDNRHERDSLLADAYEALLAAIFLEAGDEVARRFVAETLAAPLAAVVHTPPPADPKTRLQESLQAAGRGLPLYRLVTETLSGAQRHFTLEVTDGAGNILGRGEGPSKRAAERDAAVAALEHLLTISP